MANMKLVCDYKQILSNFSNCGSSGWKFIGQEQNGLILVSWEETLSGSPDVGFITAVGLFNVSSNELKVLYKFDRSVNIVQASINEAKSVLVFVKKVMETRVETTEIPHFYEFHIITVKDSYFINCDIDVKSAHQVMAQFLYRKKVGIDRFLIFVHLEGITLYQLKSDSFSDGMTKLTTVALETVVKVFSWAQWDVEHQCLYYIFYRKTTKSDELGELKNEDTSPTLSSLQFNDDFPHETVLNIPVNLPLDLDSSFNTYEDEPIPLRVHGSSMDVIVLSDSRGFVCICYHYLYQPVQTPLKQPDSEAEDHTTVHMGYSVTLLHHGIVVHCKIPGIPWAEANRLRPTFAIGKDDYLFVYLPGHFIHMLDLGIGHQPCCHIMLPHRAESTEHWFAIKISTSSSTLLNMKTLQTYTLDISYQVLLDFFYDPNIGLYNKLSIIHYILVHMQEFDIICQLLTTIAEYGLNPALQNIFHEILVSGTYASVVKSLPSEATKLLRFLPFTTINNLDTIEIKNFSKTMTLKQEALWNSPVMLLTPQQRLSQFRVDLWTQLWNLITETSCISRFKLSTVAEKLMVSLVCYQPEALSRCSTPLSPGSGFSINASLLECSNIGNYKAKHLLPFHEIERCTASKQEHVISVNLRELSIHLVKHGLENPMQVHVVATRYAAAQLEMSRFLCSLITKSCAIPVYQLKGFQLIDELPSIKKKVYYIILERYASAVDTLAYPTPQGFSSFFTYLTYKTLPFDEFVQHIQARALTLQIDVMKIILPDLGDDSTGVKKKLRLLQLLPRSRAKRLLNQWFHPVSLMIRAREHSLGILSGLESKICPPKNFYVKGSNEMCNRYSPLDTFLDLLTAKASLAELDFNLLVEAVMSSVDRYDGL
ncbi:unnamed protein product [Nezara viridula]|uniref:Gamma-secretase-activating protein C-terminal domain-containing protein n=1 Tax=Nezara viridula TaxID=85310 RepID=A0A9P0EDN1_NEZVI|nr:unnamed protein product [Nezara viridula]